MIRNRLDEIEAKVQGASNIPEDTRAQLLTLLGDLKTEAVKLAETHDEKTVDAALEGLTTPVSDFETTHPKLTQLVNRLADMLSSVGI